MMELLPGHRPARRAGASGSHQGDYDQETVYGDDPVARGRGVRRRRRALDPRRRPRRRPHRRPGQPPRRGGHRGARWPARRGCRPAVASARSRTRRRSPTAGVARVVMGSAAVQAPGAGDAVAARGARRRRPRPPRRRAGRARLDRGQRSAAARRAGPLPRRRRLRRHRHQPRRHAARARPRRAGRRCCARTTVPVIASGGRRRPWTTCAPCAGVLGAWPGSSSARPSTRAASRRPGARVLDGLDGRRR